MRNQAARRDDMAVGRQNDRDDYQYEQGDGYDLRPGYHYADSQGGQQDAEPEYDPRAYAPNPDEPYGWDDDGNPLYYRQDDRKLKGGRGGLLVVGAVLAVAIIGGAGAIGYRMLGAGGLSGEPPLIRADSEPVKTTPEKTADSQQNKAVYDRIDPANQPKAKVVSREEEPVDLPSAPTSEPRGEGARIILPNGPAAAEPTAPGTMGNEPRKVKTVAIRPDAPIAPQAPQPRPADQIAEAARSGQAPRGSEFDNGIMSDGDAPALRNSDGRTAAAPARPAPQPARPAPVAQAPAPAPRPATQAPAPAAPRAAPDQVAAVAPRAPAPAPAAAARPTAGGGFVVQVTSQRSEADARTAYSSLQKRFPQVLSPYQPSIQSATIADRGTYYRVRVGPFASSTDASTVCNNLRAAGGDCVVARN